MYMVSGHAPDLTPFLLTVLGWKCQTPAIPVDCPTPCHKPPTPPEYEGHTPYGSLVEDPLWVRVCCANALLLMCFNVYLYAFYA